MTAKDMVRMERTCKWVHKLAKENRHSFVKDVSKLVEIDMAVSFLNFSSWRRSLCGLMFLS